MSTQGKVMSGTPRFDLVTRESLDAEGRRVWDKRAKTVNVPNGHFNVLMHVPALHERIHDLEQFFRTGSSISEVDRELIILAVAREAGARFAWARHESRAKERGVPADVIEKLRARAAPESFDERHGLLVELGRAMAGARAELPLALFERVKAARGERWTVEAIALCAHYTLVAVLIHGYGVKAKPGDEPTF
jgi:alkylhydroperoxidase family enzyme